MEEKNTSSDLEAFSPQQFLERATFQSKSNWTRIPRYFFRMTAVGSYLFAGENCKSGGSTLWIWDDFALGLVTIMMPKKNQGLIRLIIKHGDFMGYVMDHGDMSWFRKIYNSPAKKISSSRKQGRA